MQASTNTGERKTDTIEQPAAPPAERTLCQLCDGLGEHKPHCARHPDAEPEYSFPDVSAPDCFGGHHLDKKTNTLWIGIKVDPTVHDFWGARAFLLGYEHCLWEFYNELQKKMRLRQQLAVKAPR